MRHTFKRITKYFSLFILAIGLILGIIFLIYRAYLQTKMIENITNNVIASFIFLLIVIFLGWFVLIFTHRTNLLKFYGLVTSRRLIIYLSNLRILPGGAIGIDGQPRSFGGSAGPFGEMLIVNHFYNLFNYLLPSLSERPGLLSKLLISDVQVQILPSPITQEQIDNSSSFVTLGGPGYNAASALVETTYHSQVRFQPDGAAMIINNLPPINDGTYGFVERIVDHERNRCVFYAAGLSELGTIGAANFLATQWEYLYQRYGDNISFVVMLRISPMDFTNWSIVFERTR